MNGLADKRSNVSVKLSQIRLFHTNFLRSQFLCMSNIYKSCLMKRSATSESSWIFDKDLLCYVQANLKVGLKWIHMARTEFILRQDRANQLRSISKPSNKGLRRTTKSKKIKLNNSYAFIRQSWENECGRAFIRQSWEIVCGRALKRQSWEGECGCVGAWVRADLLKQLPGTMPNQAKGCHCGYMTAAGAAPMLNYDLMWCKPC